MTTYVLNTCPKCGEGDVSHPHGLLRRWFCFTCEHRWFARPIPDPTA